jgi:ElaB/YqjD/DUF883 family membrane-anchored ribosome-binding protein
MKRILFRSKGARNMNDTTRAHASTNGKKSPRRTASTEGETTQHIASAAHDAVDRFAKTASQAETEVRTRASELADKARESEERAIETFDQNVRKARAYVKRNPLTSAGIAFAAGLVISNLIRR